MYWDVYSMHGRWSLGLVYAATEAEAMEQAKGRYFAVAFVKPYKG